MFFYALENLAGRTRPSQRESAEAEQERPLVYWFHVGGFAVYGALMAYLLREDADDWALAMLPYGVAMFCHFWLVDHALREEHGPRYDRSGRWLMSAGILAGMDGRRAARHLRPRSCRP